LASFASVPLGTTKVSDTAIPLPDSVSANSLHRELSFFEVGTKRVYRELKIPGGMRGLLKSEGLPNNVVSYRRYLSVEEQPRGIGE
jgi:hypothetical protein